MTTMVLWLALGLALGALASEDIALLSAVALVQKGSLPMAVGYGAAASGIFIGDLVLYLLGRAGARRRPSAAAQSGRRWPLDLAVFAARFVPGSRVPAYIAAGTAGMSLIRFALITAVALTVWVGAAAVLGAALFEGVAAAAPAVLTVAAVLLAGAFALRWRRSVAFQWRVKRAYYRVLRWKHHEFWPMWFFYPPVVLYGLYLAVRYRSASALLHVNPGLPLSGIIGESKAMILRSIPAEHTAMLEHRILDPVALRAANGHGAVVSALEAFMTEADIDYPLILKPDVGQRGSGVRLVRTLDEASTYLAEADFTVIAQEYCPWPEEVGLSYVRDPEEPRGKLTGVTRKRFPVVVGDGRRTLTELIMADPRARLIADTYLERHRARANDALEDGEVLRLVEAGNHCQGAIFEDGGALMTPKLEAVIDEIARSIPGFYAGRFDVRFKSEAQLQRGIFKIIELNGAAGEATHIYDAKKSVWEAYRILFAQLDDLFRVGHKNEQRGDRASTGLLRALWDFYVVARGHPPTT